MIDRAKSFRTNDWSCEKKRTNESFGGGKIRKEGENAKLSRASKINILN